MTQIKLKRVYEDISQTDGYRILVDRLWPRGIKKEALHYDLWAKDITPSSDLRKWVHQDPSNRWDTFAASYQKQLSESPAIKDFIAEIKKHDEVTFLYASKEPIRNHAAVLKDFVEKMIR